MGKKQKHSQKDPKVKRKSQVLIGGGLFFIGTLLIIAFISYLSNWKEDYSSLGSFLDKSIASNNILSKVGAFISHFFFIKE